MITAVAAMVITPLKMRNLAVFDPGTTVVGELVDGCVKARVEDRDQQHTAAGAVV